MTATMIYEVIGYVGSALIVLSLTRKSILKLRVFGLAGAVVFLVYSLLIGAFPIAVVNAVIILIQIFFLRELISTKDYFRVLNVNKESRYLEHFLEFYDEDIRRFQPGFVYQPSDKQITSFVLRDLVPAGLFIGEWHDDGSLQIKLDYVIPQYRDFKVGRYLYSTPSGLFADLEWTRAWSEPGSPIHAKYLEKMGFVREVGSDAKTVYVRDLPILTAQTPLARPPAITTNHT